MIIKQKKEKNQVINKKRVMHHVLFSHVSCTFLVMYHVLLVMYHVLFSHVCKPSGLWLNYLKSLSIIKYL